MGPFAALNSVIVNAFKFRGRATRPEYWWFVLWDVVIFFAAITIDIWGVIASAGPNGTFENLSLAPTDYLIFYWVVISFVPRLTLTVRRLHDAGLSGAWMLLNFVPFGPIIIFIFTLMPSEKSDNIHGPYSGPRGGSHGGPRPVGSNGKPHDPMQGYAYLEHARKAPTPEMLAERKAQVRALYEQRVLGQT